MLWRVALFSGHLHPDFIRDKLTDRQLAEVMWYFERHPFGHDVDHRMMARIVASWTGEPEYKYMPQIQEAISVDDEPEQLLSVDPAAMKFAREQGLI